MRCGSCREPFDALEHLSDEVPAAAASRDQDPPAQTSPPPAAPAADTPAAGEAEAEEEPAPQRSSFSSPRAIAIAFDPNEPATEPGAAAGLERRAPIYELPEEREHEEREEELVPDVLREDLERIRALRRAQRRRGLYLLGSALLLVGLTLQYAWFMPGDVIARYPQARPLLAGFCTVTRCTLPARRDPHLIRLLSRDVRMHPKYEGALRITATLENTAPYTQPYPPMQFTLFNVNGQVIATRRFLPKEYLAPGTDVAAGMPPGTPIQIALNVLAPEQAAVSFEFRFL